MKVNNRLVRESVLLAMATLCFDYIPQKVDLGPWLTWLPVKLVDMGVAVMVFSATGMYIVTSGKPLLLYILIILLLSAVVGQLVFMVNMVDYRSQIHRRVRQSLTASLRERYEFGAETHDTFSFIMNGIMLMGECCGINGPQDFLLTKHNFIHIGGNNVTHNATVVFPLACCQRGYIEQGFYRTLDCALSWSKQAINNQGCYKTVHAYLSDRFGSVILWTFATVSYIELIQVLLCLSLAKLLKAEKRIAELSQPARQVSFFHQHHHYHHYS
ncbi:tetraspanin [Elysia marginata]|uniref:Tetraspanin n=1 Tax=Elysia marginata TaxID=1093978 RepID=A0AAV4I6M2_9GAST|nr:tetraspanin [Elysia marginata]